MATRPVFQPVAIPPFTKETPVSFHWHAGFAPSQKSKSINALHKAVQEIGIAPVLEVSSHSPESFGRMLSAFSLKVSIPDVGIVPLESAFQGSKVFREFGPCTDLYELDPRSAKRTARERDQGDLIKFEFNAQEWSLEPKTAFYDWLYLQALAETKEFDTQSLTIYAGFTDIEFNPGKSFNCQARSCALAASLRNNGLLDNALTSKSEYLRTVYELPESELSQSVTKQNRLF